MSSDLAMLFCSSQAFYCHRNRDVTLLELSQTLSTSTRPKTYSKLRTSFDSCFTVSLNRQAAKPENPKPKSPNSEGPKKNTHTIFRPKPVQAFRRRAHGPVAIHAPKRGHLLQFDMIVLQILWLFGSRACSLYGSSRATLRRS